MTVLFITLQFFTILNVTVLYYTVLILNTLFAKQKVLSTEIISVFNFFDYYYYYYTCLTALCPGLSGWAGTRKVKPIWILLKQETVSGSGISWAECKSATSSRQITMPAPHYSVFYRPDALPAAQPTASKHWRAELLWHKIITSSGLAVILFSAMMHWCY